MGGARNPSQGRRELEPDECWFCLANPKLTKHLIASIGSDTYITLPKGPILSTKGANASLVPGGGHVLIIPIFHYPTLLSVPTDQAVSMIAEIERYKSGLRDYFAAHDASMITFEVGRYTGKGGHAHIQVCPVPNALASRVESAFRTEGEAQGIIFEEDSVAALSGRTDNYFRVGLADGSTMIHVIRPGKPFNLQFGRITLANLLGVPERQDWKACPQTAAEEKADCAKFKSGFSKYDPSKKA